MANMTLQAAINHKLAAGDPTQWISVDGAIGNGTRETLTRVGGVSKLELKVQRRIRHDLQTLVFLIDTGLNQSRPDDL